LLRKTRAIDGVVLLMGFDGDDEFHADDAFGFGELEGGWRCSIKIDFRNLRYPLCFRSMLWWVVFEMVICDGGCTIDPEPLTGSPSPVRG